MNPTDLYRCVREKEGRIYPDHVVARLPELPDSHSLSAEWRSRADSCSRLFQYLAAYKRPLTILELGCGNGWLTNQLSQLPEVNIWGLDRESTELDQAARIFKSNNLIFLSADIFQPPFTHQSFDVVVLASVIQYFPDLSRLIHALLFLLNSGGEIHLLDSPLYRPGEIPAARERTRAYYASLGFPEMAEQYYHHSTSALTEFRPHWFYHPTGLLARPKRLVGQSAFPFPWLVIR
jgi:ubiquinone/menaquinone biosynthesis C-methylase UbiE